MVSVNSFEYFGTDVRFLPSLLRVVKPTGRLGVRTSALRDDPYLVEPLCDRPGRLGSGLLAYPQLVGDTFGNCAASSKTCRHACRKRT